MLETKWIIFSGRHRNRIELGTDCDYGDGRKFRDRLRHPDRPSIVLARESGAFWVGGN
jgi:hypothetical protein